MRRGPSEPLTTAFVTGGSGFIGAALIERLRAEGWEVRALARSEAAAEKVRARGAEPVAGDLGDRGALEGGSVGCDVCFTLDISRARTELGYEPVRTREDGLAELAG